MRSADSYLERGLLALKRRDYTAAARDLADAIRINPELVEAWVVRGNIRVAQGEPFDGLLHFDRALHLKPEAPDIWNNRGLAFADIGNWENAEVSFQKSAELLDAVEPRMNLANLYAGLMRLDEAANEYRKAVVFEPGNYEAHLNLGITLLGLGQWDEGFKEYYWRHKGTAYPPKWTRMGQPWQGEDLSGKRLLLWPEQGYGDEICFYRVMEWIENRYQTSNVLSVSRAPLNDLFVSYEINNPVDFNCSTIDAIGLLGLTPFTLPEFEPYAYASASSDLKGRLPTVGFNVGICWSSGQRPLQPDTAATSINKSIPFNQFVRALIGIEGINWISLQKDHGENLTQPGIIDLMDEVHSFNDTAAIIEGLDLVISVDTAVAHLAGAMGKSVWNLVRYAGYWPWLHPDVTGNESIWYPSMKLYRQPRLFDWWTPLADVGRDLRDLIRQREAA